MTSSGHQIALSRKAKEAIKTALAVALVYGIALRFDWLNPHWAGIAVAMISLQTAGESIHRGVNRLAGTIPGCIAGIIILGLAVQSRWALLLLTCAWVFFAAYMSLRSRNNAYLWTVAGLVCLVIVTSGGSSSQDIFTVAVFRVLETALGIGVYTLIAVFLWPSTNAGAIRKASSDLIATQAALCDVARQAMTDPGTQASEKLPELRQRELGLRVQLAKALVAEGSENYEVYELRHFWDRFHSLSTQLMDSFDQWQAGLPELTRIDVAAILPDVQILFDELNGRFEAIQRLLRGDPAEFTPRPVTLSRNRAALRDLSHLERGALAVARDEFKRLETLTTALLECASGLTGQTADSPGSETRPAPESNGPGFARFVFDRDHLVAAAYAATTVCAGFLIWIVFDPPGHNGWIVLTGVLSLATVHTLQAPMTNFIKPLAVAIVLCGSVYVFIMPQLSSFLELGLLLFLCMFINRYFFAGIAQAMGTIGIVIMMPIQTQQTYNFAMLANSAVYLLMVFTTMFALSYLVSSPRPEKHVMRLVRRFFRGAEFLLSPAVLESSDTSTRLDQWKKAFYAHELKSLPGKIAAWGKAINPKKFSGNKPEQVQALATTMEALVHRIEHLLEAGDLVHAESLALEMSDSGKAWRMHIESAFERWSQDPEIESETDLGKRLADGLAAVEQRIDATIDRANTAIFREEDVVNFYRLLGAYRGVSEAAVAYAGTAGGIDWADWREERF